MCKIDWNLIMQIFSAIGSMLVVIIAIWGDWIRTKLVPPKLRIIASNTKGELTTFSPTGVRVIYYHFKVINSRPWSIARNCRVLLKAVSKARLYGYESYKEAVNFIALNYPNSPEGKKAEEMMQNVMPSMANKEFIDDNDSNNFKVVYQFENDTQENIDTFKKLLEEAVKDVEYFKLSVSEDIYNSNTIFINID